MTLRIGRVVTAFALALGCASGGAGGVGPSAADGRSTGAEVRALDAVVPEGALEAAFAVGGATEGRERSAMVHALDARLARIVAELPSNPGDPTARPRALLEALFSPRGGRPLLAAYEADASTLFEVVTTGRFNCVSATTLYIVAARRAGVDARPVLLPSHARALVLSGDRRFVVETTTAHGFDPPAWVSREALDRARPKGVGPHVDLYADEKGTEVDWNALLGIAYGNLGIMAEARGETALAAALLAREVMLTPKAQAPLVQAQRVSLLTQLATRALGAGRFGEALALARRADDAAPDGGMKSLTDQNVAAIASQELTEEAPRMDDVALTAFPERVRAYPAAYGDVRALSLTMMATRRLGRGDLDGSAAALHEAAGVATSRDVRGQAGHNARLGEINRLGKLSATDPEAAWEGLSKLGPRDPALGDAEAQIADVITRNRAVKLSNAGRCVDLSSMLAGGGQVVGADALLASCHARHGIMLSDRGDMTAALDELRAAVRLDPAEARHRQNLVAVIEKQIDLLANASKCSLTPPLIAEGRALDPTAAFFDQAAEFCRHQN